MVNILILIVLVLVNAFFAGSEIALISLNKSKVKVMVEDNNKLAKIVYRLIDMPTKLLSTIQIGVTLSGFLNSALASDVFADDLVSAMMGIGLGAGISVSTLRSIAMLVITIALTFVTLVFGELVPKRIAMNNPEKFAFRVAYPIYILNKLVSPFVAMLSFLTNLVLRIIGIDPNKADDSVTEEEIRLMVATSSAGGVIRDSEKEMIENIFEFDDTVVEDVMTHRTEIEALSLDAPYEEVLEFANNSNYTRIPIYKESIDNIVGILHIKDLLRYVSNPNEQKEFAVERLMRKPLLVPDSKSIDNLFYELKSKKNHIAIVIDEYGGTAGIVTMEDLIEEIVGEVFDEYDEIPFGYKKLDESTYVMDGSMELDEVEKLLEIEMPIEEFDTLNGFIIAQLGRLPNGQENASVEYEGYTFRIVQADDKVVEKVKVEKNAELLVG